MKRILQVLAFSLFATTVYTQTSNTAIVFQTGHSYSLMAPEGWSVDTGSASAMMLDVCFHPDSVKWTKAPVVMYSTITHKTDSNQTIDEVITMDIEKFKKSSPGVEVSEERSLMTFPQNQEVRLVRFTNDKMNNYESVAYIEEDYHVVMIVVGSRERIIYESNLEAFEKLAQSYFNLEQ